MAVTKYTYSIATDTASGAVDLDQLTAEIAASVIVIASDHLETLGDVLDIWMKDALTTGDETALDTLVQAHTPAPVNVSQLVTLTEPHNTAGLPRVQQDPRLASTVNFYCPNLCDKTAWWSGSAAVTEETLTDSGDHITYNMANTSIIDLTHAKVFNEHNVLTANPACAVLVEVQVAGTGPWVAKTQNKWLTTDGDYDVDFENGDVIFNSALGATDLVRASYSYADKYDFKVQPAAGKKLLILYTELQYTPEDVAPQSDVDYVLNGYDPGDPPNKIPYGLNRYRCMYDYFKESTGPYPTMEASGVVHPRTNQKRVATVPFKYNGARTLYSSQGLEIQLCIENDIPYLGTLANATFYCISEDE